MNKKEINEIKRQFTEANCTLNRIRCCYVDYEKQKKTDDAEKEDAESEDGASELSDDGEGEESVINE